LRRLSLKARISLKNNLQKSQRKNNSLFTKRSPRKSFQKERKESAGKVTNGF
jgi:hypothetical protein